MSDMREQQVLKPFKDNEVLYVRGRIDWEPLDDGRDPPRDIGSDIAVTVQVDENGYVYDVLDLDWG